MYSTSFPMKIFHLLKSKSLRTFLVSWVLIFQIGFSPNALGASNSLKKRDGSSASRDKDISSAKDSEKSDDTDDSKISVTEHSVIINGKKVNYRATAGYMFLKDYQPAPKKNSGASASDDDKGSSAKKDSDKGEHKKKARVFFIAYEVVGSDQADRRPVSFSFNGGPGSASVWLHMGALGPKKAVLTSAGEAPPPPYRLEENPYSWLDKTDLVFIDPVSTGFSRSEPDEDPKNYHGYKADIESVGEFIRLYLTKYDRWQSPKFIVGESYGTTRAAGLSNYLQNRYSIYLNGIVLVSSVLNFANLDFAPGNDLPFVMFLPSYAATAWYHKKLPPDLQGKSLEAVLKEAEEFASNDYLSALHEGDTISDERKRSISRRLAGLIGLDPDYVAQLNYRVSADLYFNHLLMNSNRKIGRFDSRYTGLRYFPGTERYDYDPSFEAVSGPFTATFNHYVKNELQFESELPYEILADVNPWKYNRAKNRYLNVAEDLRKAMTRNPYLKVLICSGYYDLATPYFASKKTINHMYLDPSVRDNVSHCFYKSGHMMYVKEDSLKQFKSDFAEFLDGAILPSTSAIPTTTR